MEGKKFEIETAHWSQLRGNRYSRKLNPMMLYMDDPKLFPASKLKGEGKYSESKPRRITYDREYAIAKVINDVFKPLGRLDDEVIDEFLAEAKRRFRDE